MAGFFADDGKGALRRAIEAFEAGTAAELVIAVRPASDRYAHVPALVGGLAAALTLAFLLYGEPEFGLHWFLVDPLLAGLAAGWLVRHSHALARALTPRAWREEAVLRAAKAGYLDHGVAETRGRTGVFLYVSLTERAAVVLADVGVRREVPREPWERACAGLQAAVAAGARAVDLAPHLHALAELCADALPRSDDDVNELPDEVLA
jgi:putative membrane protein